MITVEDLKKSFIFGQLSDEMLKKVISISEKMIFDENEYVYRSKDKADNLYLVKQGKVLLEQSISDKITVSVDSIKPGFSFGWVSLLSEGIHKLDAVCAEPSNVSVVNAEKLQALMESDQELGFRIMKRVLEMIKSRLDRRTDQFVRSIATHPDIYDLEE